MDNDVNSLENGKICLKHNCALCCHETRMYLIYIDINRITKLGYNIASFAERYGKIWRLKNIDGKCFFLNGSKCKIYRFRPYGCRLYPLIYDQDKYKITLDELCPYREEFKVKGDDIRRMMFILKMLGEGIHF